MSPFTFHNAIFNHYDYKQPLLRHPVLIYVFQPEDDAGFNHHMLKIKSTMEIAPEKAYGM